MTNIAAIPSISGANASTVVGVEDPTATTATTSTDGSGFASSLSSIVDGVSSTQNTANTLAVQAATGDLTDIHKATIAATRAQVTMELVTAVRNKGIDAFNQIMNMQA
jgi:flagellar hook-basal body complex protein FliE